MINLVLNIIARSVLCILIGCSFIFGLVYKRNRSFEGLFGVSMSFLFVASLITTLLYLTGVITIAI